MKDQSKTKQALIQELASLRERIKELEQLVLDLNKAEESLREREAKCRLAFESTSDGIFTIDHNFNISSITPSIERQLGYKVEEVINRPIQDLNILTSESLTRAASDVIQVLSGVEVTGAIYEVIAKDGTRRIGEVTGTPIIQEGKILGVTAVVRDVTDRKQAEKALREQGIKLLSIFRAAPVGIGMVINRVFQEANDMLCHMTGYNREELLGRSARMLYPTQEDYEYVGQEKYRQISEKITGTVETHWKRKDGTIIDIILSSTQLDPDNLTKGVTFTALDITEVKQAEEALRASEEKYRSILENIEDGYFEVDLAGNMTFFNPAMCKIANMSAEELLGMNNREYTSPETAKKMFSVFNEIYRTGQPGTLKEYEITKKDGIRGNLELSASLIRNREGKPMGFRGIVRDVTERKMWEGTLRRSEEKYRSILENIQEGYFEVDLAGKMTFFNDVLCNISGYSRNELLNMQNMEYLTSESNMNLQKVFGEVYRTGQPSGIVDYDVVTKDGNIVNAELSASLIKDEKGKPLGFRAVARNVTDRKHAEEMLRRSEEKFRFLTEKMNDNIFTMDLNLRTTYVSQSMKKILGFTPEERMKQHITEQVTPASMTLIGKIMSEELEREQKGLGDPDRSVKFEVEYYHKDGSTVWMENVIGGIRDDQGVIVGIHGVSRDITERRESEHALKESFNRLRKSLEATVQAMAVTVETRDPYTAGHQRSVADLARAIATEMNLPADQINGIRMAAAIHDLGKISVPAEILSKPTKLTNIEFELIKTHAQSGYDILKDIDFPWPIARMVLEHHERMDGSGYPYALRGDQLLLESLILMVADVVEAMASHRPYRPSRGIDAALEEIERNRGTLYDNTVVDACLSLFREKGFQLEGA